MTCITNASYVAAATSQRNSIIGLAAADIAVQEVIGKWQRDSSKDIVNFQIEVADRQVTLAEKIEAHAEQFWPKEKELVDDVFNIPKRVTQYEPLMTAWDGLAQSKLEQGREDWLRETGRRCINNSRCMNNRWQRSAIHYRNDIRNFAAREDENRTEVSNDFRYAQQVHVLSAGRGAFDRMMSYWEIAGGQQADVAETLTNTVNSALNFYGYVTEPFTRRGGWGGSIRQQLLSEPTAGSVGAFNSSTNTRMTSRQAVRSATQGPLGERLEELFPQGDNNG